MWFCLETTNISLSLALVCFSIITLEAFYFVKFLVLVVCVHVRIQQIMNLSIVSQLHHVSEIAHLGSERRDISTRAIRQQHANTLTFILSAADRMFMNLFISIPHREIAAYYNNELCGLKSFQPMGIEWQELIKK